VAVGAAGLNKVISLGRKTAAKTMTPIRTIARIIKVLPRRIGSPLFLRLPDYGIYLISHPLYKKNCNILSGK
jgi:hypothetical protein